MRASGHITEEMAEFAVQRKNDDSAQKQKHSRVPMVPGFKHSQVNNFWGATIPDSDNGGASSAALAIEAVALETPPAKKARQDIVASPTVRVAAAKSAEPQPDLIL